MKNNSKRPICRDISRLAVAVAVFVGTVIPMQAATYTYGTTAGLFDWSTGANWNAVPVSASDTTLSFAGTLAPSAALTSNNDIAGNFLLNRLQITYAGTTTAGSLVIQGNQLEFVSNGGTEPSLYVNLGGTPPSVTINNDLLLTNNLSMTFNDNTTLGGVISGGGNLTKITASTTNVNLTGTNTYTGATTLGEVGSATSASTMTLGGADGAITSSSGITINGAGTRLILDSATTANSDRLGNSIGVTVATGGDLNLVGNGATSSITESVGNITLGTGNSTITISGTGAGQLQTLAASGFTRTGNATGLVRGTSLGQAATDSSRITLGDLSGLTFVGATTANGSAPGSSKDVKIVPYLFGESSATGTGVSSTTSGFVTYDTTGGLRRLGTNEYTTLSAGFDSTVNVGHNVKSFSGTLTNANPTVNSLLMQSTNTLTGSGVLTVSSGAVATNNTTGQTATIGSGFSELALGNGEGVVTVNGNLNISAPISVTSSGGLTKGGTGVLILNAANLYTGATTVNSGTLRIGNSGSLQASSVVTVNPQGTLSLDLTDGGTFTSTIVNSGTISKVGTTLNNFSGDISGTGSVAANLAGSTLGLTGTQKSYTGATSITNGTLRATGNVLSPNSVVTFSPATAVIVPVLQLRADSDTVFQSGGTSFLGSLTAGLRSITIDVDQANSGNTDKTLELEGAFAISSIQGIAQKVTVNVTGANGYGLTLGDVTVRPNSSGGGWADFNVTAPGGLRIGSVSIPSGGAVTVGFTGSEDTTITGDLVRGVQNMIVDQNGSGALTLEGSASTTGAGSYTFNLNAGSLNVNHANALGTGGTRTLNIAGGTLDNTSAADIIAGSPAFNINGDFAFGGTKALDLGTGATTLGTTAGTTRTITAHGSTNALTIGGIISNGTTANSITKDGTGTVILGGANAYTGLTTVSNGTLLVNSTGSINSSSGVAVTGGTFRYDGTTALDRAVTLNGGKFSYNSVNNYAGNLTFTSGTIGGSNISNLDLTINTGKTMSPGNSTGTMAAGATTWATGGSFLFELNDTTGTAGSTSLGWDLLNAASLNITAGVGEFTIQIASLDNLQAAGNALNFDGSSNYTWLFVDAGAPITGFNASSFILDDSAFANSTPGSFSISQGTGGDVDKLYLNYTGVIPEPSTYAMLIGGLGLLAFLRRRKQS